MIISNKMKIKQWKTKHKLKLPMILRYEKIFVQYFGMYFLPFKKSYVTKIVTFKSWVYISCNSSLTSFFFLIIYWEYFLDQKIMSVAVSSGCQNIIPRTEWLKPKKLIVFTLLKAKSSKLNYHQEVFLVRSLFVACS
jgi:hypothetical protein